MNVELKKVLFAFDEDSYLTVIDLEDFKQIERCDFQDDEDLEDLIFINGLKAFNALSFS